MFLETNITMAPAAAEVLPEKVTHHHARSSSSLPVLLPGFLKGLKKLGPTRNSRNVSNVTAVTVASTESSTDSSEHHEDHCTIFQNEQGGEDIFLILDATVEVSGDSNDAQRSSLYNECIVDGDHTINIDAPDEDECCCDYIIPLSDATSRDGLLRRTKQDARKREVLLDDYEWKYAVEVLKINDCLRGEPSSECEYDIPLSDEPARDRLLLRSTRQQSPQKLELLMDNYEWKQAAEEEELLDSRSPQLLGVERAEYDIQLSADPSSMATLLRQIRTSYE